MAAWLAGFGRLPLPCAALPIRCGAAAGAGRVTGQQDDQHRSREYHGRRHDGGQPARPPGPALQPQPQRGGQHLAPGGRGGHVQRRRRAGTTRRRRRPYPPAPGPAGTAPAGAPVPARRLVLRCLLAPPARGRQVPSVPAAAPGPLALRWAQQSGPGQAAGRPGSRAAAAAQAHAAPRREALASTAVPTRLCSPMDQLPPGPRRDYAILKRQHSTQWVALSAEIAVCY